jgi:GxxExxY protein
MHGGPRITRISRIREKASQLEAMTMHGNLVHAELSQAILGAAMTVLNELKPGLDEKLYENALVIELQHLGHQVKQQARYPVFYRSSLIGTLVPDLIVDELVVVDTKVVECFIDMHTAKMLGYLAKTNLELALLINFKYAALKWKRVVRQPGLQ